MLRLNAEIRLLSRGKALPYLLQFSVEIMDPQR